MLFLINVANIHFTHILLGFSEKCNKYRKGYMDNMI